MGWRTSALVFMTAALVVSGAGAGMASCVVPRESMAYVVGMLTGDDVEGTGTFADPGPVIAIVERETVKRWDAIPSHTTASATVVTRHWGHPPQTVFTPVIDGGEPTTAPETTISCDPSTARPVGETELGVVFERAGYVPLIDQELTGEQERVLTEALGPPIEVDRPPMDAEHPMMSDVTVPARTANGMWWLIGVGAVAVGAAGWATWRTRRPAL